MGHLRPGPTTGTQMGEMRRQRPLPTSADSVRGRKESCLGRVGKKHKGVSPGVDAGLCIGLHRAALREQHVAQAFDLQAVNSSLGKRPIGHQDHMTGARILQVTEGKRMTVRFQPAECDIGQIG